jgi:tetratricopeptide (TPR) repeat protein
MDLNGELVTALAKGGRYRIERELGHGGMAIVYLARDVRHDRFVALKVLHPHLATALGTERFLREIAIAASLVHPNILALYDSGEASGFLYYVMPYVEGLTLRQRLDRELQLPIEEALSIARQIAAALDHAHAHGVVHRDIKPENVLLLGDQVLVADFGLARAITSAASTPLTSNLVVGTPAYMSPEQCTPGRAVDARSDIYSLGCLVFEMIAGVTPFRGATAQVMISHHLTSEPPSVCAERHSCPPGVEESVRRALAKAPADRFRSAGEFVRAMTAADQAHPLPLPSPARRRRARQFAIAAGIVGVGILSAWYSRRTTSVVSEGAVMVDTMRVALLPLEGATGSATPEDELLYEAFARWQDVNLVDPFQVTDAVRRHGHVASEDDARAVARALGAGRYVRGRVTRLGDSLSIRAGLYDVTNPQALHIATARTGAAEGHEPGTYDRLADSLLLRGVASDGSSAGGRRSLGAVQAFAAAGHALDDFDLPRADSAFEAARAADAGFARANLWLAQVRAWRELPTTAWRDVATRAEADREQLGPRERQLARALLLLADGQYDAACHVYDALRASNDRDFVAWYGLGQCRRFDRVVVPDASSPSGWRFRSSRRAGLAAYERALELFPSVHRGFQSDAFASLRELLLTGRDQLTYGFSPGPDSARFLARPAWLGDSIALIPYPWAQITGGGAVRPPGFERALAHQRAAFQRIANSWSTSLPRSASAKEALALSLEMLGDPAAADTLRSARMLTGDPVRRLQLATAEALLRVKLAAASQSSDIRLARVLADSLLTAGAPPASAQTLAPVAELLGHCDRAAGLARLAAALRTQSLELPRHYGADGAELLVRAAMSCRSPASGATAAELLDRIRHDPAFDTPQTRRMAEDRLVVAPAQLSIPWDHGVIRSLTQSRTRSLIGAIDAAIRGDTATARRTLAVIDRARGTGLVWIEAAYPEARLRLVLGDTTEALRVLTSALDAVRTYEPSSLTVPGRTGSFIRSMALRAELERARGAAAQARPWAVTVAELWSGADNSLQPLVDLMRKYARS